MRRDQGILQIVSLMLLALVVSAWLWRRLDRSAIERFGDAAYATVFQSSDPAAPLYAMRLVAPDNRVWFESFADGQPPRTRWRQCPQPPRESLLPSGQVVVAMSRFTFTQRGIPYFHELEIQISSGGVPGGLPTPNLEQESIRDLAAVMSAAKQPQHPRWITPQGGLVNSRFAPYVTKGPGRYVTEWRWRNISLTAGLLVVWMIIMPGLTTWLVRGVWRRTRLSRRKLEAAALGNLCLCCGYEPRVPGATTCPECGRPLRIEDSPPTRP